MSDVIIKFSQVGADGVTRAFEAQNLSIDQQAKLLKESFNAAMKADGGMKKFGDSGVKTMDLLRDGVRDLVSDLAGIRLPSFSGGMGGFLLESAGTAIDIAKQEEQRKRAQQEATRVAALGAAERRRAVILNLPDDEFLNAGNIDSTMSGVSSRTKTDLNKVQAAMVPTLSATGALSNDFAVKALERSFSRMPNDEQFAVDYSGRLLDLMNIEKAAGRSTDDSKFDQLEGAMLSTAMASRVTSLPQLAKTAVPLAKAMSQTGDSTERAFEYFAAMSLATGDAMGDKTRTTMAGLASHLSGTQRELPALLAKKDSPLKNVPAADLAAFQSATNTDERLAALHKSPALFKALDDADQFNFGEADTKEVIRSLLQGKGDIMGQLAAATDKVKFGDEAIPFLSKKMTDLDAGPHQGILDLENASVTNVATNELGQTLAQRNAAARKLVTDTRGKTGAGWLQRQVGSFEDWSDWDSANPEASAERRLQGQRRFAEDRQVGATGLSREKADSDVALIKAQIEAVRALKASVDRNTAATQGNTNSNGGVERPPPAPASSDLAN